MDEGQRIRFCLNCGEVMSFSETTCPSCGHFEPPTPVSPGEGGMPCAACGAPIPEDTLFCPGCGEEPGYQPPPDDIRLDGLDTADAGPFATFAVALAVLAPVLVGVALLLSV